MNYKLNDFDYILPDNLIAQFPLAERSGSRLMCINSQAGTISHEKFTSFASFIQPGDLIIFNNTKVIPARLHGYKETGGKIECLVERFISEDSLLVHLKSSKAPKIGSRIFLGNSISATVNGRKDDLFVIKVDLKDHLSLMENVIEQGELPLPHYISHTPQNLDYERYQTIFAAKLGAVAAPTAGLHFDQKTMEAIRKKGGKIAYITLHVGGGTFKPIRENNLDNHLMHSENIEISSEVCKMVNEAKSKGNRIIAIGTTVVRALETAATSGELLPFYGETKLFIRPSFKFKIIDSLLTNFHLPKSSLLVLVSAFAGHQLIMQAYQQAIQEKYRFYSYGDAMLIS